MESPRSRLDQLWDRIDAILLWLANCQIMLYTWRKGIFVGCDRYGNSYYHAPPRQKRRRSEDSKVRTLPQTGERRWVLYNGEPDASKVPPEWHRWLHHTAPVPLEANGEFHQPWQKEHQPNLSGTAQAYLPPGHPLHGRSRASAVSDYEPWHPTPPKQIL